MIRTLAFLALLAAPAAAQVINSGGPGPVAAGRERGIIYRLP